MNILSLDIGWLWSTYVGPILQFVVGLGAVVFFHELGHFTIAKLVGIKVERFAIGMGPRLLGIRGRETDYCICALPLGGYVKMLGQEDFKPLQETDKPDPRSFESKSVGARMAVVAAGVVMNVILAAALFVIVGRVGKNFVAPVVGDVAPGSPAANARIVWQEGSAPPPSEEAAATGPAASAPAEKGAGLKGGDRILKIEGEGIVAGLCGDPVEHFQDVSMIALLSGPDDKYTFTIERTEGDRKRIGRATVGVKSEGGMIMFGIAPALDMVIGEYEDAVAAGPFRKGDRIVSIGGQPIEDYEQIRRIERGLASSKPLEAVARRDGQEVRATLYPGVTDSDGVFWMKDGTVHRGKQVANDSKGKTFTIRRTDGTEETLKSDERSLEGLHLMGMTPRMCVGVVIEGSPAQDAGMQAGDVIVGYGQTDNPTFAQFKEICEQVVGEGTTVTVLRDGERLPLPIVPKEREEGAQVGILRAFDVDHAVVAGVLPNSPAARIGIAPDATILAVDGESVVGWNDVYQHLCRRTGSQVSITWQLEPNVPVTAEVSVGKHEFAEDDYRYVIYFDAPFEPLQVRIKQDTVLGSLAWGGRVTIKLVLSPYVRLRSLIRGWSSLDQAAGPVGLGILAVKVGRRGFMDFLYFMGFLSAALAVFNFLPMPVVDGGLAVFLIIEKIRGKPLPVKVMNFVQIVGLVLLVGLLLVVTWNDIMKALSSRW